MIPACSSRTAVVIRVQDGPVQSIGNRRQDFNFAVSEFSASSVMSYAEQTANP